LFDWVFRIRLLKIAWTIFVSEMATRGGGGPNEADASQPIPLRANCEKF
jgi:hypothetical protein